MKILFMFDNLPGGYEISSNFRCELMFLSRFLRWKR